MFERLRPALPFVVALLPVMPAIANAIFDAVGVRMRQVPFTPERVLSAMRA